MVNPPLPQSGGDDRGQLLLVGAFTIAFVIIGLVVVINTVLYTENVATGTSVERIDDTGEFDYEARKNTRSLALRVSHSGRNLTGPELGGMLRRNFTTYSGLLAESYADSRPTYVNITYNNDSSVYGTRLTQTGDGTITTLSGQTSWSPVPVNDRRDVGWFVMNVNVPESTTDHLVVNITNGTGEYVNLSMDRTGTGPNADLNIRSRRSLGLGSDVSCDPSSGRVLVDVRDGDVFTGDCSFNAIERMEPPYSIEIAGGDNVVGKYGLIYNGSAIGAQDCTSGVPTDDPCTVPALWQANITTTYESGSIEFSESHNVSVYIDD